MDIIIDNMKKESKLLKAPMICFFVLAAIFPVALVWNELENYEFILGQLFFILSGCYYSFAYLYNKNYTVLISTEKIVLHTLFKEIEITIANVKKYDCKRYRKTEIYQFILFENNKKILINTRFKDELEMVLNA